jgi:hypothetical protein
MTDPDFIGWAVIAIAFIGICYFIAEAVSRSWEIDQ